MSTRVTLPGSRFTFSALIVFGSGSLIVLGLETAERANLISDLTESVTRLLVCSFLLCLLINSARSLSQAVKLYVVVGSVFVIAELSLQVIEDIEYLNQLPLVGHDSRWRHTVEKAIVCGWTFGAFFLPYALMRRLESSYNELHGRERELKTANAKLESTLSELRDAQTQLVRQERLSALGQMASGVAHDLNNALSPVLAFASVLESVDVPAKHQELLETMQTSAEHAGKVIKQLQHFYRRQSENDFDVEMVNLPDVVMQAIQLTRFQWHDEALRRGVNFQVVPGLQDECHLLGNPTELTQLVHNLIVNAIEAMPNGGRIVISIAIVDEAIQLSVSDEGVGMSREQQERCFEPYFSTKARGSGLGLSVCHGIVLRHGGRIEVQQASDGGTRFVIRFPRNGNDANHLEVDQRIVLYIDDEAAVRTSTTALLKSFGVAVDVAEDGPSGIKIARDRAYDLVIVDYSMPGMTGYEVMLELNESIPGTPVVITSGWSRGVLAKQFRGEAVPDMILEKPVNLQAVKDCLKRFNLLESS